MSPFLWLICLFGLKPDSDLGISSSVNLWIPGSALGPSAGLCLREPVVCPGPVVPGIPGPAALVSRQKEGLAFCTAVSVATFGGFVPLNLWLLSIL